MYGSDVIVFFIDCFFSVRLFVGSAWSFVFFIPTTTANDLRVRRISVPDLIHYIYFPILILEKEPVFPFLMLSAKQGHYLYHFYNVFGMTRSLTGDWTRDIPHSMPALYHQAIEEAVFYDYIIFNRSLHYKNLHSIIYNIYYFFTQFSTWHKYMFVFRQVDVHMFQCTNTQKRRNKTHYNLRYFIFSIFVRLYFIITIKCN